MKTVDFSKKVYVVMSVQVQKSDATHFAEFKHWIRESTWEEEINYFQNYCTDNDEWINLTMNDDRYPPYEVRKNDNGTYSVLALTYMDMLDRGSLIGDIWYKCVDKRECLVDGIKTEEEANHIKDLYYYKDIGECCSAAVSYLGDTFGTREEAVALIANFLDCDIEDAEAHVSEYMDECKKRGDALVRSQMELWGEIMQMKLEGKKLSHGKKKFLHSMINLAKDLTAKGILTEVLGKNDWKFGGIPPMPCTYPQSFIDEVLVVDKALK